MSKRIVSFALSAFLITVIFNWSCTKIDTTNIGADLLPAVDNINTFADTLAINTAQGIFTDSTKLTVSNTAENYVFGKINDPLFGQTEATLYLQLKPSFYPFYLGNPNDTILGIDSIVLCLGYKAIYGDTMSPIQLQVHEVDRNQHGVWDSLGTYDKPYLHDVTNFAPNTGIALSNPTTIDIHTLSSYRVIGKGADSVINQIRIPLNNQTLIDIFEGGDSAYGGPLSRDTLFRARVNNGFAVSMPVGNALIYTQLGDKYTRLEIHYKRKNGAVTKDTSMTTLVYNNGSNSGLPRRGAVADHIVRTRTALPTPGDQEIYLQTAPGLYASLKIPQLTGYSNRIVHRAELLLEQIPTDIVNDGYFSEPNYLYVDLVDSGTSKWKPIYYDLNPSYAYDPDNKTGLPFFPNFNVSPTIDYSYFGGVPVKKADPTAPGGERIYYSINVTRYVQQIVTKQTGNYEMRLFAPYNVIYPQYSSTAIPFPNLIAAGRVRLGGGNATDPKYRMRLRVIYSNIK
ncbi:MAG: DUF4270 family protein [Bacteroidetes bacterium]|nr:DUF4270 family protein [Bacteroidota bacterium]